MAMVMADDLAAARGTLAVGPTVEGLIAGVLEPDADRRARLAAGLAHPAWPERVAAGPVVLMARGLASGPGAVADGPHLLAGDLRLDNRDDLCRALGLGRGASDAWVALAAYRRWGEDFAAHLIGDFAVALWDGQAGRLVLARDALGVRPFYHARAGGALVFASAFDALAALAGVPETLDLGHIRVVLEGGARAATATVFADVRKLAPAHVMVAGPGARRLTRYWSLADAPEQRFVRPEECAEAARALLVQAVEDRLGPPGAMGVHLSGGLDSSAVAILVARAAARCGAPAPKAYAWHPPPGDAPTDDHRRIDAAAAAAGLRVAHCPPGPGLLAEMLAADPVGRPVLNAAIALETASRHRAAADGVRVVLSGLGGDEGIGNSGAALFAELLARGRLAALILLLRATDGPLWKALLSRAVLPNLPAWAIGRLASRLQRRPVLPSLASAALVARTDAPPRKALAVRSVAEAQRRVFEGADLSDRLDEFTEAGLAAGVSYRYPLLDRRLVAFAAGMPPDLLREGGVPRAFYRRVLAGILPPEMLDAPKSADRPAADALTDAMAADLVEMRRRIQAARPHLRQDLVDLDRLSALCDPEVFRADPRPARLLRGLRLVTLACRGAGDHHGGGR